MRVGEGERNSTARVCRVSCLVSRVSQILFAMESDTGFKTALAEARVPPEHIKGIGFDATCSLAVTDTEGNPVVVTAGDSLGSIGERNVILWADHRAEEEADLINKSGSKVLDYVGGTMSVGLARD